MMNSKGWQVVPARKTSKSTQSPAPASKTDHPEVIITQTERKEYTKKSQNKISRKKEDTDRKEEGKQGLENKRDLGLQLCEWNMLPAEVMLRVLIYLTFPDLEQFCTVSWECRLIGFDDEMWKPIFLQHWPKNRGSGTGKTKKKRKTPGRGEWRARYYMACESKRIADKQKQKPKWPCLIRRPYRQEPLITSSEEQVSGAMLQNVPF